MSLLYTNSPDWYDGQDLYNEFGVRAQAILSTTVDVASDPAATRYTTGLNILRMRATTSPAFFAVPPVGKNRDTFPSTLWVGGAFMWQDFPYQDQTSGYGGNAYHNHFMLLHFISALGDEHVQITLEPGSGHLLCYSAGSRDSVGTYRGMSTATIPPHTWGFLEAKVVIHDTTGTVDVWWNGDSVLSLSGLDTKTSTSSYVALVGFGHRFSNFTSLVGYLWRDMYICDDGGSAFNSRVGDMVLETVRPNGAGNYTAWTPSAGSNYQNVDETTIDDTTYNKTSTATNKDTYAMSALSSTTGTIKTVGVSVLVSKMDAGQRTLRPMVRSGTTDGAGTTRRVYDAYHEHRDWWDTNPATAAAWTPSEVNSMECGLELVA